MKLSPAGRRLFLLGRLKHWGGWLLRDRWMMLEGRRDLLAAEIDHLAGRRPASRALPSRLPGVAAP